MKKTIKNNPRDFIDLFQLFKRTFQDKLNQFEWVFHFKSLWQKLISSFSMIILFILFMVSVSIYSANQTSQATNLIIEERLPALMRIETLSTNFVNRRRMAYEYIVTGNKELFNEFRSLSNDSALLEAEIQRVYDNDEMTEVIERSAQWTEEVSNRVINEAAVGNRTFATENMEDLKPLTDQILEIYATSVMDLENEIAALSEDVLYTQERSMWTIILLGIVATLISVIIAWLASKSITEPVKEISARLHAFSKEDFSGQPIEVQSEDEIGEIGNALNVMQENLVHLMQSVQEAVNILTENGQAFEGMNQEVQTGTTQISATMQELASGTETQANHSSNLASDMTKFATKAEETLAFGYEISNASKNIVDIANQGNASMTTSTEQMDKVQLTVEEASKQMKALNHQTLEISNLIELIHNIAQQTNLLALNASIEAARAGDQGRGFAVVADEVRKLAEEVAASVQEITNHVQQVQSDTKNVASALDSITKEVAIGTNHMHKTENNITEITESIQELENHNLQMVRNLTGISKQSHALNQVIEDIAAISQESAAGVEETSASVEEINASVEKMSTQAEGLTQLSFDLHQMIQKVNIQE